MSDSRLSTRQQRALDELHDRPLNFAPIASGDYNAADGWSIDRYCQELPAESPGPPSAKGPYAIARDLMRDYEFADPKMVTAIYRRDAPLEGRDMLLELRSLGVRIRAGCRVGTVTDEVRRHDGREVAVWGWGYRTLQGHLETGQMDYELWKWLDNGTIEFRVHVISRPSKIRNPIIRLGARLIGRRLQIRFAQHACERMLTLTQRRLSGGTSQPEQPSSSAEIGTHPA